MSQVTIVCIAFLIALVLLSEYIFEYKMLLCFVSILCICNDDSKTSCNTHKNMLQIIYYAAL